MSHPNTAPIGAKLTSLPDDREHEMPKATDTHASARLVTGRETGGVTVLLKPEGIAELVAAGQRGDVGRLARLLPRLDVEQRELVLEQLDEETRAAIESAPAQRRAGRPAGATSKRSPVAIARSHSHVTQAELAERLGKRDSAVRNAEARGFGVKLSTLAEYAGGLGARVDVVITHADGTEARIPVPREHAA